MFGEYVALTFECMRREKLVYKDYLPLYSIEKGNEVCEAL